MIYLDYNATTPVRPEVVDAMAAHLGGDPGNPSSLHGFGRRAAREREAARAQLAAAVGCEPREVVFTSGGTEANNLAIRGVLAAEGGGHLVTAASEHEATLQTAEALSESGVETTILPVDEEGRVDPAAVEAAIRPDTTLVSLMAANNETGARLPLEAVAKVCRARGVLFHTDAVQFFGKCRFRFAETPVDLASVSSHKIGGPKGVGALIVRAGVTLRPLLTGGGQERAIRPGTENLPGLVGFGKAAESSQRDITAEGSRLEGLRDRLENGILRALPTAKINAGGAARLPNTANVTFPGLDGESLLVALDLAGVAVSTGAACTAGSSEPSHVLMAMGRSREDAGGSIRFSLGWGTTESEIEDVVGIIPTVAARLASAGTTP